MLKIRYFGITTLIFVLSSFYLTLAAELPSAWKKLFQGNVCSWEGWGKLASGTYLVIGTLHLYCYESEMRAVTMGWEYS